MICLDCDKEIMSIDDLPPDEIDVDKGKLPKYSRHWWCNKPNKLICCGHVSPPGLDEIERWPWRY